mgnify:CR=1 FL=1
MKLSKLIRELSVARDNMRVDPEVIVEGLVRDNLKYLGDVEAILTYYEMEQIVILIAL